MCADVERGALSLCESERSMRQLSLSRVLLEFFDFVFELELFALQFVEFQIV